MITKSGKSAAAEAAATGCEGTHDPNDPSMTGEIPPIKSEYAFRAAFFST
ncbi:hypothetical protein OCGS_0204 [Oceaniovalibus guishaninsula JLT2003]|uniref:Uncharacterized protein n=1 Tax=Oceaniovalibus guishaninsula JLT2003 TaxID=1231392 RepID=K2HGM4_9RHOB|nr:hypothetical protein OCGS_0204 [Oceaniovalibus guishaninsula JLT2003]